MQADNKKLSKKALIIGAIIIGAVLFFYFRLDRYLTLEYLKGAQATFQGLYEANRLTFIAAYTGIYIVATAMSLPGATVLTLAGGGIFGLVVGTVVVSFASTIGATLACLVSRFLLRDWVQHKFSDKLVTVNEGIAKEGAFYLFSLRLVPLFPFFVINLVMGLTRMELRTYFWVSQVGMLPATIVYINAGKELAKIETLKGILSPGLLVSFAILGLFPLIVNKLLGSFRARTAKVESENIIE